LSKSETCQETEIGDLKDYQWHRKWRVMLRPAPLPTGTRFPISKRKH